MWIVHVVGHADGEAYIGPFPDKGHALGWMLITLDGLEAYAGHTSAYVLALIRPPYTV